MKTLEKIQFKSLHDVNLENDAILFSNYYLTDLMLVKKNNRRVKSNENYALYLLLCDKLASYGISLMGEVKINNLTFRGIRLLEDFSLENEPILKQLYGYTNIEIPIHLRGFETFSTDFLYKVESGACTLRKHSYTNIVNTKRFTSLREMYNFIKENGHDI